MAETTDSTTVPTARATRENFDQAFSDARIINDIIRRLANGDISSSDQTCASLYAWLAQELDARLERVEVADQTMRSARA